MAMNTHIVTHQTRCFELWASVLFGCHRGLHCPLGSRCAAGPLSHAELFPCADSQNAHQTAKCKIAKCKISWAGENLPLERNPSLFGQHGWTRRKLQSHGFRCVRLRLTFHAFHKANISQKLMCWAMRM